MTLSFFAICAVFDANPVAGEELLAITNKKNHLVDKIVQTREIELLTFFLSTILYSSEALGEEIWEDIDKKIIADIIQSHQAGDVVNFISNICESSKCIGDKLWKIIDKETLAKKFLKTDLFEVVLPIIVFFKISTTRASELLALVGKEKLAQNILETDLRAAIYFICEIFKASPDTGTKLWSELWSYIDKKMLADKITELISGPSFFFTKIFKDKSYIRFLSSEHSISFEERHWPSVDVDHETSLVVYFICEIFKASPDFGKELWSHIDKKKLAAILSSTSYIKAVSYCISKLFETNLDIGNDLWENIKKEKLALNITQLKELSYDNSTVYKNFREKQLHQEIDDYTIRITATKVADWIKQIYNASPKAGKELLQIIKNIDSDSAKLILQNFKS